MKPELSEREPLPDLQVSPAVGEGRAVRMATARGPERLGFLPVAVRPARLGDLPAIEGLIAHYTADGTLLPRGRADLLDHLGQFRVATAGNFVVACGALQPCDDSLAEIRTIAVLPGWRATGLGHRVVSALLVDARRLGLSHVACLTRRSDFFAKHGFAVVDKEQLPEQFWTTRPSATSRHRPDKIAMEIFLAPRVHPELMAIL